MGDTTGIDLSSLPPIYVIPTNVAEDELHEVEDAIFEHNGQLSYLPTEARIFLSSINLKKRVAFELRNRGVWTEEVPVSEPQVSRKRKLNSSPDRELAQGIDYEDSRELATRSVITYLTSLQICVIVLKLNWLKKSIDAGHLLPTQPFQIYSGRIIENPKLKTLTKSPSGQPLTIIKANPEESEDATQFSPRSPENDRLTNSSVSGGTSLTTMKFAPRRFRNQKHGRYGPSLSPLASLAVPTHPRLHRTTTSEHDFKMPELPPPPAWMTERSPRPSYACLRSTSMHPPNKDFLENLYKIKEARILTLDEIGVRAYSSAIASISAYPHIIANPSEIISLPGCSDKIAALWQEWFDSSPTNPKARKLSITEALDNDEDLKHLKLFYNIWGVGAETARKFYYEHRWKDLDDVVEYGWSNTLSRVQQIGVKFYDDFQAKISRSEVETVADTILHHARTCKSIPKEHWSNPRNNHRGNWNKPDNGHGDPTWNSQDMICVIVGGYRRGKLECGDVDVILSHRSEEITDNLVIDVVRSLETSGHITHTLTLHTTSSDRGQQTLPFRNVGHSGHGFDTLDKALCVWQDPEYDKSLHAKNPNIHRRVDIIVSPWRTIGAAVLGWSGATTFQRDVRRWCRKEKGWKFDSSGVRDRSTGKVLDFEGLDYHESMRSLKGKEKEIIGQSSYEVNTGDRWEDRERELMEGLGIGWRPASERCTG